MRVEKLLKRLRREFIKVNMIQAILDSLLFFLSANLVLFLFSISLTASFENIEVLAAMTVVFLMGDLVYRTRKYRLEIYEEKNPELEEILRTARDNLDRQNIVSQALFDDLLDRARTVTSESIIPSKRIIQKILMVGLLSFLTVFSGITSFQLQEDGGEILPEVDRIRELVQGKKDDGFQLHNSSQIYGDSEDIDASEMDIQFNITGEGEAGESSGQETRSIEELALDISSSTMDEDLELAKEYSIAIKEIG